MFVIMLRVQITFYTRITKGRLITFQKEGKKAVAEKKVLFVFQNPLLSLIRPASQPVDRLFIDQTLGKGIPFKKLKKATF